MSNSDEIQTYIEQYGSQFHKALALKKNMEKYPSLVPSKRLAHQIDVFQCYMQIFLSQSADNEAKKVSSKKSTWKDVQEEADQALKLYQKEGKSWRHPFQTTGRAFSNVASRLDFLLELLPRGEYTSILFGGLTLVFNAAKRMKVIRESIFKTFDGLSDTLDNTNVYIRYYSGDQLLRQKAEDLYIAILDAVKGIISWLGKNPLKESFKAFFLQEEYGKKLEEKMTDGIQDAAAAFEECIKALLHGKVDNIDSNVADLRDDVSDIKDDIVGVSKRMVTIEQGVLEGFQEDHKINKTLAETLAGVQRDFNWLCASVNEMRKDLATKPQQNLNYMTNMTFMAAPPTITVQQLLDILDAGLVRPGSRPRESISDTVARDRDSVSHFGRTLNPSRQEGIATIMQDPCFQSWIMSAHSHTLIINGMEMDSHWQESVSPISYMCYLLSETLSGGHSTATKFLNFYCGLHSMPGDSIEGANGIIRSIITQLLQAYSQRISLPFLDLSAIQRLQNNNIEELCFLLERLLGGIGVGIISMMIDGISWYESEARLQETATVMRFLNSLVEAVEAGQTGLVLKLMVTSPAMSRYCREWFPAAAEVSATQGNALLLGGGLPGGFGGVDEYHQMLVSEMR